MNLGPNTWRIVGGVVLIAVGLLLFPIVLTGADAVRTAGNVTQYTGVTDLNGIIPILALIGLIGSGGYMTWTGIRNR